MLYCTGVPFGVGPARQWKRWQWTPGEITLYSRDFRNSSSFSRVPCCALSVVAIAIMYCRSHVVKWCVG
jgi:hypothetical protein